VANTNHKHREFVIFKLTYQSIIPHSVTPKV